VKKTSWALLTFASRLIFYAVHSENKKRTADSLSGRGVPPLSFGFVLCGP
jgi:hypothetical protein